MHREGFGELHAVLVTVQVVIDAGRELLQASVGPQESRPLLRQEVLELL